MQQEPYKDMFYKVEPNIKVEDSVEWTSSNCEVRLREPQETKKGTPKITTNPNQKSGCC